MLEPKITADLKNLKKLTKQYPEVSKDVRISKLTEAVLLLEREVKLKTPEGAGPIHLRDSIHSKVRLSGQSVRGILGTPLAHAEPVEFGTRPHFPPTGPIQHWVERKLGISGKEAESAAFLIARAISRRGTKGAHMFEKGFEENQDRVLSILGRIPEEIINRINAL